MPLIAGSLNIRNRPLETHAFASGLCACIVPILAIMYNLSCLISNKMHDRFMVIWYLTVIIVYYQIVTSYHIYGFLYIKNVCFNFYWKRNWYIVVKNICWLYFHIKAHTCTDNSYKYNLIQVSNASGKVMVKINFWYFLHIFKQLSNVGLIYYQPYNKYNLKIKFGWTIAPCGIKYEFATITTRDPVVQQVGTFLLLSVAQAHTAHNNDFQSPIKLLVHLWMCFGICHLFLRKCWYGGCTSCEQPPTIWNKYLSIYIYKYKYIYTNIISIYDAIQLSPRWKQPGFVSSV